MDGDGDDEEKSVCTGDELEKNLSCASLQWPIKNLGVHLSLIA